MTELDDFLATCTETESVLLFGSQARGDSDDESDIDVLKIVSHPAPPVKQGRLQVSQYTLAQLIRVFRSGSLFAYHLKFEGVILQDSGRNFEVAFESLGPPDLDAVRQEMLALYGLLRVSKSLYNREPFAFNRLCSFVLRTTLYARAFPSLCFSYSGLRSVIGDERVAQLVALKRSERPKWEIYESLREFAGKVLESDEREFHSTEEELLERTELSSPLVALSLSRILGRRGSSYEWTGQ